MIHALRLAFISYELMGLFLRNHLANDDISHRFLFSAINNTYFTIQLKSYESYESKRKKSLAIYKWRSTKILILKESFDTCNQTCVYVKLRASENEYFVALIVCFICILLCFNPKYHTCIFRVFCPFKKQQFH